jgi:hypothetical protein
VHDEREVKPEDRLRLRLAWVITCIWALCFPLVVLVPTFPITLAQAPMLLVAGWLFTGPLLRRNGNGDNGDKPGSGE